MLNLLMWLRSVPAYNLEPQPLAESSCLGALALFGECIKPIVSGLVFLLVLVVLCVPVSYAQAATLQAVLTWQDSDTTDSVQIDKAPASSGPWATLSTVAPGVLTYTDATNAPGQTACYRVENFNSSGNGPSSNVVCKTFPSVPTVAPVLSIK